MLRQTVLALALAAANAECPNACSGHGYCGTFDECTCFPNWMEADCSGRTCPFAPAHVDTPKGDLDGSADALTGPGTTVVVDSTVYPFGTTEQYPLMVDSAGTTLINTAHAYAECGNKGVCDRKSGECDCFPGYAGAGCQKAACADPTCSGHGTCMTAEELAFADYGNEYKLWDAEVSMGCKCEPGYSGPSCSDKMCKYGLDPLYIDDDMMSVRAPTARVVMTFSNTTTDQEAQSNPADVDPTTNIFIGGTYAIKFYDAFGEDYETEPLVATAPCATVTAALEALPNSVISAGSVSCAYVAGDVDLYGIAGAKPTYIAYDLTFQDNLGDLKPIEVNAYLDGARPTLYVTDGNSSKIDFDVDFTVYPNYNGISGEFVDYFAEYCSGVTVNLEKASAIEAVNGGFSRITAASLSAAEEKSLKRCLGDADGSTSNNVEVYNWDYGLYNTTMNPHIVKLAPHPTSGASPKVDAFDAGKYHLVYYGDGDATDAATSSYFYFSGLPDTTRDYIIFTTEGTATVLGNNTANGANAFDTEKTGDYTASPYAGPSTPITAYFGKGTKVVYTSSDISCDSYDGNLNACLQKGDKVFLFNNQATADGAKSGAGFPAPSAAISETTGNMYEVVKVGVMPMSATTPTTEDRFYFVVDKAINWDGSATFPRSSFEKTVVGEDMVTGIYDILSQKVGLQTVVKFDVSSASSYDFVSQCSGRGLCSGDGLCECFTGYTSDNCDTQSALAV